MKRVYSPTSMVDATLSTARQTVDVSLPSASLIGHKVIRKRRLMRRHAASCHPIPPTASSRTNATRMHRDSNKASARKRPKSATLARIIDDMQQNSDMLSQLQALGLVSRLKRRSSSSNSGGSNRINNNNTHLKKTNSFRLRVARTSSSSEPFQNASQIRFPMAPPPPRLPRRKSGNVNIDTKTLKTCAAADLTTTSGDLSRSTASSPCCSSSWPDDVKALTVEEAILLLQRNCLPTKEWAVAALASFTFPELVLNTLSTLLERRLFEQCAYIMDFIRDVSGLFPAEVFLRHLHSLLRRAEATTSAGYHREGAFCELKLLALTQLLLGRVQKDGVALQHCDAQTTLQLKNIVMSQERSSRVRGMALRCLTLSRNLGETIRDVLPHLLWCCEDNEDYAAMAATDNDLHLLREAVAHARQLLNS